MLKNLNIKYKLLASYSIGFILSISLCSAVIYSFVRKNIEANIESELRNSTTAILNMVETSAAVSIKNHLRAVAEKNMEIVSYFYSKYQQGALSEVGAREQASNVLLSQTIGESGYIYCVDSTGMVLVHPQAALLNTNVSNFEFVRQQLVRKQGYIEYDWKNPGETIARPKALYMVYFAPWDWIISVSSYRKEFEGLVKVEDFKESILALRFGKTGYSYVLDREGTAIIHPKIQGVNILKHKEIPGQFLYEMLDRKTGKIVHAWKNPDEPGVREKLVMFNYIPEFDWIVASSSYLDEFYGPLKTVRRLFVATTVVVILLLVLPITFKISSSITQPLQRLMKHFDHVVEDNFSHRMEIRTKDEIGQLSSYFNRFMDQLQTYHLDLKKQMTVRQQVEEDLRESEARYRSVMEAAPDPIVVYDMAGMVTYLNAAFTRVFGWALAECAGKTMDHFVPEENWAETRMMIDMVLSGKAITSIETRRYTKNGDIVQVSINAATYCDRNQKLAGSVIILRDISEAKKLELQVMNIGDRVRQKIGQDLHDDLCPHLIGTQGLCTVLKDNLEADAPEDARLAGQIAGLIEDATQKTRTLARGLCPVHLVSHGLQAALANITAKTESVSEISCRFSGDESVYLDDNSLATHLYYIAQEAINNTVRHSGATVVEISLFREGENIHLRIKDNGQGIPDTPSTDGIGLQIMRYRATMIAGSFEIYANAPQGTCVHVFFKDNILKNIET